MDKTLFGPGDLPLCIDLTADIISGAERFSSNTAAMFGSMVQTCRDSKKSSILEGVAEDSGVYNN